jgi:hypothetical protein
MLAVHRALKERLADVARAILLAAFILALVSSRAIASDDAPPQGRSIVDIRMPPPGIVQQMTLSDGSRVYGRIESVSADEIVFRTLTGILMTVPRSSLMDLQEMRGRVVKGEFLPADSHDTRLFFAPTARSLKAGQGYLGTYEVFFPFVQVGVTDRLSLGGGTPLIFVGDFHPLWITPKFQIISRERTQAAVGVIHITGTGGHDAGIAYGVTTLGGVDQAGSVGVGYAYSGRDRAAIIMVGGEARASRHVKWKTENWISRGGNGFVSGGVRFLGDRLSADLGLIVPLTDETVVVPMVSFAWRFGR